jgi:hypothetical protein
MYRQYWIGSGISRPHFTLPCLDGFLGCQWVQHESRWVTRQHSKEKKCQKRGNEQNNYSPCKSPYDEVQWRFPSDPIWAEVPCCTRSSLYVDHFDQCACPSGAGYAELTESPQFTRASTIFTAACSGTTTGIPTSAERSQCKARFDPHAMMTVSTAFSARISSTSR